MHFPQRRKYYFFLLCVVESLIFGFLVVVIVDESDEAGVVAHILDSGFVAVDGHNVLCDIQLLRIIGVELNVPVVYKGSTKATTFWKIVKKSKQNKILATIKCIITSPFYLLFSPNDFVSLSPNISSLLVNEPYCIKSCWGVCEQNSIVNGVCTADWIAALLLKAYPTCPFHFEGSMITRLHNHPMWRTHACWSWIHGPSNGYHHRP